MITVLRHFRFIINRLIDHGELKTYNIAFFPHKTHYFRVFLK